MLCQDWITVGVGRRMAGWSLHCSGGLLVVVFTFQHLRDEDYTEKTPDVTAVGTLVEVKDPKALRARLVVLGHMWSSNTVLSVFFLCTGDQTFQGISRRHGPWARFHKRGFQNCIVGV